MEFAEDPGLDAVLQQLRVQPGTELGRGGEARVYAIDDTRVLRVLHAGGLDADIRSRQQLVDELAQAQPPYALPQVLEVGDVAGRVYAIERRRQGRSLLDELATATGAARRALLEAHLDTAAALGDLHLEPRPAFGDLIADAPVTAPTWRDFLETKVAANLARSTPALRGIDPVALAAPFEEPANAAFVHLDAFAGNMLTDGTGITAVLDFGVTSVAGDRRFDPLATAAYLTSSTMTPMANAADHDVVRGWLRDAGQLDLLEPMRRWLAGYWSFALDDVPLIEWCHAVLR